MAEISLVGVVIGGVIGFSGGLIGPLVLERRKQIAERKKKRAEKMEELASLLYKHQHWIKSTMNFCLSGAEESKTISPFARIEAITRVYFHELHDSIHELDIKADQYEKWLLQERDKRIRNPRYQANIDEAKPYYTAYLRSLYDVLDEIKRSSAREFNPDSDQKALVKYAERLYAWIGEKVKGVSGRMKREGEQPSGGELNFKP